MELPIFLVFLGFFAQGFTAPVSSEINKDDWEWFYKFKYLEYEDSTEGMASLRGREMFKDAIKAFQRFLRLPETGIIDARAREFMQMKRCGMPDNNLNLNPREKLSISYKRKKRYILQGSQFNPGSTIKYKINNYSKKFQPWVLDIIFRLAFQYWSDVANIKFQQVTHNGFDMEIKFVTGYHGDFQDFDGLGGMLAHAYFPIYGGDQHYDDAENWTFREDSGTDLLQTIVHEIGHTMGMDHSRDYDAVMFPYIRPYDPEFALTLDDVLGAQALYGPPVYRGAATRSTASTTESTTATTKSTTRSTEKTTTTTTTPTSTTQTTTFSTTPTSTASSTTTKTPVTYDNCYNGSIDAATQTNDSSTYIFVDEYVYKIDEYGTESGYPVRIDDPSLGFYPLSGKVDAALYWPFNGKNYVFQGDLVYIFKNREYHDVTNASAILKLPPYSVPLDSAFYFPINQRTYITKGDLYWRFDSLKPQPIDQDLWYPRPMSVWSLPGGVDAAFQYSNGKTFFFKGNQYYKFNERDVEIEPGYPRPINRFWFGCKDLTEDSTV